MGATTSTWFLGVEPVKKSVAAGRWPNPEPGSWETGLVKVRIRMAHRQGFTLGQCKSSSVRN